MLAKVPEAENKALLEKWFQLDTNVLPHKRVLQPVTTYLPNFLNDADPAARKQARDQWWVQFEKMTLALRTAALLIFANDRAKLLPYEFSVTENEIRTGLLALPEESRKINCIWFKRNITDLEKHIMAGDKRVGAFTDLVWGTNNVEPEAKRLLDTLRTEEVPAALLKENVHEYDVEFAPGVGIDPIKNEKHAAYIATLVEDFQVALIKAISANLARLPLLAPLESEIVQHGVHAQKLATSFTGRSADLDHVRSYLRNAEACAPLIIHSGSGMGKSALMAAAVEIARQELQAKRVSNCAGGPSATVIVRFIGLTSNASDVNRLDYIYIYIILLIYNFVALIPHSYILLLSFYPRLSPFYFSLSSLSFLPSLSLSLSIFM